MYAKKYGGRYLLGANNFDEMTQRETQWVLTGVFL